MKRATSIEALLRKSQTLFADLKLAYKASLHEKHVREDLKVDIKNLFENLRSCLDYLAHDIFETHCPSVKTPDRLYFPIRSTAVEFNQVISRDFPGLQAINADIYGILESVQPYRDPWLGQFNRLNNDNKHQDLVEQTRTESQQVTVSRGGGAVSWGPGVTFGGGVSVMGVPIDPRTQMPVPNNVMQTQVITWVDFHFKENGMSVLPFVDTSLKNVEKICHDLLTHI
jgi:hypothetical protein